MTCAGEKRLHATPEALSWRRQRVAAALLLAALLSPACQEPAPEARVAEEAPVFRGAAAPERPTPRPSEAAPRPPTELVLDDKLDAIPLGPRESHDYVLEAAEGEILLVGVEQQGVDVAAVLFGPGDEELVRIDSPSGAWGEETLLYLASSSGTYRLKIEGGRSGGLYGVRFLERHEAGERDRRRYLAARSFDAAEKLRRQRRPEPLRRAIAELERALALYRELGDVEGQANVFHRIGLCHVYLDERREAVLAFEEALPLLATAQKRHLRALTLQLLGSEYQKLGEYVRSRDYYLEAHTERVELADRLERAKTANNLAIAQRRLGELQEALHLYDQALALWQDLGDRVEVARTRHNRGRCLYGLGDYEAALDDFRQALAIRVELGDYRYQASTLTAIGVVHESRDQLDEALDHYERALALREEYGEPHEQAATFQLLAGPLIRKGRAPEALDRLRRALRIFEEEDNPREKAWSLLGIGLALHSTGELDEARDSLERALQIFEDLSLPEGELAGRYALAALQRQSGELEAARSQLERCVARIESLRSKSVSQPLRASYFATKQDHYEALVEVLMSLHGREPAAGHDREALTVAERARARSQLEILAESHAGIRGVASPEQQKRLRELTREIYVKEEVRRSLLNPVAEEDPPSQQQVGAVERDLRLLLREHEQVQAEVRRTSPRYAAFTRHRPLVADEIQTLMDDETLMLQYKLGDERSFVWAVSADTVRSFELAGRARIEAQARRAHRLLALSHQREGRLGTRIALEGLADLVLGAPAEVLGEKRRLLVVADGALQYIPFGVLPAAPPSEPGGERRPLVVEHEITSIPSASMLATLRRELGGRPKAPRLVAMIADPVFQGHDPRFQKLAGDPDAAAVFRGVEAAGRRDFERLVYSRREAEAVLALVPAGKQLKAFGFDANLDLVLGGALKGYQIVHFATHGELDSEHPELSRLVLSLLDEAGRERDGFLHAQEIYDLELDAELVVLSACETALGKEIRGEGLVGLTQAFLYAGAARVMVSLWQVNDQATAELMSRFYHHHLSDGMQPAAALRQAQLEVAGERPWQAPYYWAGFTLQGPW